MSKVIPTWKQCTECKDTFHTETMENGKCLLCKSREVASDLRTQVTTLTEERDRAREERDRLATDALCVLSGAGICTPEKGYVAEPYCLESDLRVLVKERDRAREELGKAEQRIVDSETRLISAGPRDKWFELKLKSPKEIFEGIVASLVETIQAAPNYAEMTACLDAGEFTVTVQRRNYPTPHQKRQEAERERDELRATVERQRVAKEHALKTIREWRHTWMTQKEMDSGHFERALRLDGYMGYDLSSRINEALEATQQALAAEQTGQGEK